MTTLMQKWKTVTPGQAIIIIGIIIGASILIPSLVKNNNSGSETDLSKIVEPVTKNDHRMGASEKKAKVTFIEYSDIDCPFCKQFHPVLGEIVEKYDDVAWVYRHFPIPSLHPRATKKAEAAECIALQGGDDAFWALLDDMFEFGDSKNSSDLDRLPALVADMGYDADKFTACLDNDDMSDRVQKDIAGGAKAGVKGTPHTFVILPDGEILSQSGAVPIESIEQLLEQVL